MTRQAPMPDLGALGPPELVITRTVDAERALVWRLWTESRHLAHWWGPHWFTNPECSIDPQTGGELRILMRAPDGEEFLNVGTVQVADAPDRLVFTIALLNADGSRRLENLTSVDFVDRGLMTEVTVRVQVLHWTSDARENLAGMRDGWTESLERLSELKARGGRGEATDIEDVVDARRIRRWPKRRGRLDHEDARQSGHGVD